jgi:hypothetical protein
MNLHELKIWMKGFYAALNNQAPNRTQWQAIVKMIEDAKDISTEEKDKLLLETKPTTSQTKKK